MGLRERFFGPRIPTPEEIEDARRFLGRQQELSKRLEERRAKPARQHVEEALARAGLPADLEKFKNGCLAIRMVMGQADHIYFAQIHSVTLEYYEHLRIHTSVGWLNKPMTLAWKEDKKHWAVLWYSDSLYKPETIRILDLELV